MIVIISVDKGSGCGFKKANDAYPRTCNLKFKSKYQIYEQH